MKNRHLFFLLLRSMIIFIGCICISKISVAQYSSTYIVPQNDIIHVALGDTVWFDVSANDFYPMPIDTQISHTAVLNGTLWQNPAHQNLFWYAPNATAQKDSFDYFPTVASATIPLFVHPRVRVIVDGVAFTKCNFDFETVDMNGQVNIDVIKNDFCDTIFSINILRQPAHGSVVLFANGKINYTPSIAFTGRDSFKYQIQLSVVPNTIDSAWVYVSVCQPFTPSYTVLSVAFPIANMKITLPTSLATPIYYGLINDTSQHYSGYTADVNSFSFIDTLQWNIPLNTGTHVGCVYIADNNFCTSKVCFPYTNSSSCGILPNDSFTFSFTSNQLSLSPFQTGSNFQHYWKVRYINPYVNNLQYTSNQTSPSFSNLIVDGVYQIFHKITDTTTHCSDTTSQFISIHFADVDTFSGYVWWDNNVDGFFQFAEQPIGNCTPIKFFDTKNNFLCTVQTFSTGYYEIVLRADTFIITGNNCTPDILQTYPLKPVKYTIPALGNHSHFSGINFAYNNFAYNISGKTFYDTNGDGIKNGIESAAKNSKIDLLNISTASLFTDTAGNFSYNSLNAGGLQLSPELKNGFTVNPNYFNQISPGNIFYSSNIGYTPLVNPYPDFSVNIIPLSQISNTNNIGYNLLVKNKGNNAVSGSLAFNYPTDFIYASSSPNGTNDASNYKTVWSLPIINSGDEIFYRINFTSSGLMNAGSVINCFASVATTALQLDSNLKNNTDTIQQIVVTQPLPYFKNGTPLGINSNHRIPPQQNLTYTIHFQNTFNNPSVNVIVVDTLDIDLDILSLQTIGSSHSPCIAQREGRVIKWVFNNILLPDSSIDKEGSKGFVSFKIKPLPGLPQHKLINNRATIYFNPTDKQNTNTAFHTIEYFLNIDEMEKESWSISVFPNPTENEAEVSVQGGLVQPLTLTIYNSAGKKVAQQKSNSNHFVVKKNRLSSGIYFLEVSDKEKVIATKKLIIN